MSWAEKVRNLEDAVGRETPPRRLPQESFVSLFGVGGLVEQETVPKAIGELTEVSDGSSRVKCLPPPENFARVDLSVAGFNVLSRAVPVMGGEGNPLGSAAESHSIQRNDAPQEVRRQGDDEERGITSPVLPLCQPPRR